MNKIIRDSVLAAILLTTLVGVSLVAGYSMCVRSDNYQTYMKFYKDRNDPALLEPFVEEMMDSYKAQVSQARRQVILDTFIRVTGKVFKEEEHKRHFAALLGRESKFNPDTQSSKAGAVGIAQIMPQYALSFAETCDIGEFSVEKDLRDIEINMTLGACLYRDLISEFRNNPAAAAAAYNGGRYGKAVSQLQRGHLIDNQETSSYVANLFYKINQVKIALGMD